MDQKAVMDVASKFFDAVDIDKNGEIDFGEWSAATINKRTLLNETNLKSAFDMFDKDANGSISAEEVAEILGHNL
jgi:calcium-dependent protein kinase